MIDRILAYFKTGGPRTALPRADAQHALGALLVRVAKADRAYLFEEVEKIDKILQKNFGLNVVEAAKMRAACERLEEAMPETAQLSTVITASVPEEEREQLVTALWQVALADGFRHAAEDQLLTRVSEAFGLAPERSAELLAQASG